MVKETQKDTMQKLQRNFDLCVPRKGTARPQPQFPHSCVCEQFIYSHDRSTYFPVAEYAGRSWEYINRTQKHDCMNWVFGRAVPFLGIYVYNFQHSIFAVNGYKAAGCKKSFSRGKKASTGYKCC
jgi:hypothetical protein